MNTYKYEELYSDYYTYDLLYVDNIIRNNPELSFEELEEKFN